MSQPAIVLLSGGLDSATTAAIARSAGFALHALSIDYGQRHRFELAAAARVARSLGVAKHVTLKLDLASFGGSALTSELAVPKDRPRDEMEHGIPITYVPARNTVFLSLALAFAESCGAADLFIGVNAFDYSGYPDCRPEYFAAYSRLAELATRVGVEGARLTIHTPLIGLTKAEIVTLGLSLGVDYGLTSTCYDPAPDGAACGHCEACLLRLKGFEQAGLPDPARYQAQPA
jgi:7-cyano-7-deazaguanine synthase